MALFSTFNPSTMPANLIEGTFVQRESLAVRLVDIFEESALRGSKHNVLLVGPRGVGKSHLVSVVYHRLKAKSILAESLAIAYLREDEWGINSFLDLLLRTRHVIREDLGLEPHEGLDELSALSATQAEDYVWRSLQNDLGSKTLLMIVENLDALFNKIGEHGQRQWRALIQTYANWAVLATTPALFSGISRQISPFYGFFEVIHLQSLSVDDAVGLLKRLALWNHDQETANFLNTPVGRARVRAVQHLAGGNHRIFVLFYDFLNQGGTDHFVTPLLKTVDALTPYYQSQMARLSPQQQKIVNFLCEHQKPATVTAIARNCFTTHQTAAGQLKHLLTHRYVRVDRVGRESFYELTEPLLRICVEAKSNRGQPLDLLVDFIRYWFSREELERKLSDTRDRDLEKNYFIAALKEYDSQDAHVHLTPEIASLCLALSLMKDTPEGLQRHAQELAELSNIAEDWYHYARALAFLDRGLEAIPMLNAVLSREPQNANILRSLANLYASTGSMAAAEDLNSRAIEFAPEQAILWLDKGQILTAQKRTSEAWEALEKAATLDEDLGPHVAVQKARIWMREKKFQAVRKVLSPFLSKGKGIPYLYIYYGIALLGEDKFSEALEYCDKAVRAFEHDALGWGNRGVALCGLERYHEALVSFDRALEMDPGAKTLSYHRCDALLKIGQYEVAVDTATPEDLSHAIFHQLLRISETHPKQGQLQQELLALKNAHSSQLWQSAFLGGLTQFANLAKDFDQDDLEDLQIWNSAMKELFANLESFSILLKLFEVLTRVKVFNDRKALLELPREQRLLLIAEGTAEEEFLNRNDVEV